MWSDSDHEGESDHDHDHDVDGECAGSGHGLGGARAADTANALRSDAVDGHANAPTAGPAAGKKRGRKPRKTAGESTAGEEKAKRSKQASQEVRENGHCISGDGSDNATNV